MMRAKLAQLLSVVAMVCFSTSLARAQGVRIFLMGSGSFLEDNRTFNGGLGVPYQSSYASGAKITFGGELSLAKILGFEASYGYGRNNLRLTDQAASQTFGYGVREQRLSGDLVVHSPVKYFGVRPYASGGLEYDHLAPTSQATTLASIGGFAGQIVSLGASNKLGFNYGAGVEWSSLPNVALRLDVRDHVTSSPTYGLTSSQFPISGRAHDAEVSVGVVFHIGK